jgi:diguanylate cyclase (GGDEF)-like protein
MDSAKLIKLHVFIAKIEMIYLLIFILYKAFDEVDNISLLMGINAILVGLVIVDYLFSIKEYYHNFKIIRIIRSLMAMWTSGKLIILSDNTYLNSILMLFYISFILEIMYLTNMSRFRNKILLFAVINVPMPLTIGIRSIQIQDIQYTISIMTFYIILNVSLIIFIAIVSHIYAEHTIEKKILFSELIKTRELKRQDQADDIALENAYEKLSHENSEMLIENLIQQYISSSLEISNLMKLILESLSEALVVNLCSIVVKDEHDESYQYNSRAIGDSSKLESFNSYIEDGSLVDKFKDIREPFIDNQVNLMEYDFLEGMNIKSLLIYPLVNEGNWLGMLVIGKDTKDYFIHNMSFFERVSTQFSIALMNARIYTKMENMAMKDGLTGIYNRTYMIQKINEYISGVVLNKSPLVVILFDIDKFKDVNDTYGHLFGDEVIRVCANKAKEIAEEYDGFVARYGGEEFVIVCKEDSIDQIHKLAEALHEKINQTEVNYRGSTLFVDVSIGVAAFPATCDNPAELIDRADKAMYHSKLNGRGCITFDGEYV